MTVFDFAEYIVRLVELRLAASDSLRVSTLKVAHQHLRGRSSPLGRGGSV
jgi:hypothetical protein